MVRLRGGRREWKNEHWSKEREEQESELVIQEKRLRLSTDSADGHHLRKHAEFYVVENSRSGRRHPCRLSALAVTSDDLADKFLITLSYFSRI